MAEKLESDNFAHLEQRNGCFEAKDQIVPSVENNAIIAKSDARKANNPAMGLFPSAGDVLKVQASSVDCYSDKAKLGDSKPCSQFPTVEPGQHPFSAGDISRQGADGIDQKDHGDCVFESSVAALAGTQKGQELIANMITQGQNGDFVVKFAGDANPVDVTPNDLKDKRINSDESAWGQILEAAFVKSHPDAAEGKFPDLNSKTPAQYDMNLLTGNIPKKIDASDGDAAANIQQALEGGNPVVAFCKDKDGGALVDGHEWTVTSYDPKTQEVTVRNPWGNFQGTEKDGIRDMGNGAVKMPFSTFQRCFGEVTSPGLHEPPPPSLWNQIIDMLNPFN